MIYIVKQYTKLLGWQSVILILFECLSPVKWLENFSVLLLQFLWVLVSPPKLVLLTNLIKTLLIIPLWSSEALNKIRSNNDFSFNLLISTTPSRLYLNYTVHANQWWLFFPNKIIISIFQAKQYSFLFWPKQKEGKRKTLHLDSQETIQYTWKPFHKVTFCNRKCPTMHISCHPTYRCLWHGKKTRNHLV